MQWIQGGDGAVDIAEAYAWPDASPWVRAMMVMSLDGSITGPDGRSGSISNPTDRAVMAEVRREADAVLIGASTMRAERYSPMRGRPTLVMVSGSLDLPWEEPAFTESDHQPIVITGTKRDRALLDVARSHADVIEIEGVAENGSVIIDALVQRGLTRIVCEGGAGLLGTLEEARVVDEYDVAISPMLMFGGQPLLNADLPFPHRLRLQHVIEDDGFLFTKYVTTADA